MQMKHFASFGIRPALGLKLHSSKHSDVYKTKERPLKAKVDVTSGVHQLQKQRDF